MNRSSLAQEPLKSDPCILEHFSRDAAQAELTSKKIFIEVFASREIPELESFSFVELTSPLTNQIRHLSAARYFRKEQQLAEAVPHGIWSFPHERGRDLDFESQLIVNINPAIKDWMKLHSEPTNVGNSA